MGAQTTPPTRISLAIVPYMYELGDKNENAARHGAKRRILGQT